MEIKLEMRLNKIFFTAVFCKKMIVLSEVLLKIKDAVFQSFGYFKLLRELRQIRLADFCRSSGVNQWNNNSTGFPFS